MVERLPEFRGLPLETGIWSFVDPGKGVHSLSFESGNIQDAMVSVKNLIVEILNPEIDFIENKKVFS